MQCSDPGDSGLYRDSVLALSRLRLYSAERRLASCHPRCLVSCSNTDSHDVRVIKQHEEIFRVSWGVTCYILCQKMEVVGCMCINNYFYLPSRFFTFDDSQHLSDSVPSHHMVLSSRCPLDLCTAVQLSVHAAVHNLEVRCKISCKIC